MLLKLKAYFESAISLFELIAVNAVKFISLKEAKLTLNEEEFMNKKSAEYLRKLGYLVEENIYQEKPTPAENLSIKEPEERAKFLATKFQEISDIELIKELKKRVDQQAIKLTIYPLRQFVQYHNHIFIAAQDATKEVSFPLPIEIKKEGKYD